MNQKMYLAALILVLLVAGAGYFFYTRAGEEALLPVGMKTYESAEYGIAFQYPETYALNEQNASKGGKEHYSITLADAEALKNTPANGEGPTAITFDIFTKDSANQTLDAWIRSSAFSNFKLSAGTLTDAQVGASRTPGKAYAWDGLYRGETIAFEHKGRIIMTSVTSLTTDDAIRTDFARIIATLELK